VQLTAVGSLTDRLCSRAPHPGGKGRP